MSATTIAPTTTAARAEGVSKFYGSGDAIIAALKDVHVSLEAGDSPRSWARPAGQVDLAAHARRPRPADVGEVFLGDTRITTLNDKALTLLRRDQIGFIFQSFNLLPTMSAAENIVLPIRIAAASRTRSGSGRSSTSWASPTG